MNVRLSELSVEDKIQLVEDLWDSISEDQAKLELSPNHKALLDRRLDQFELDGDVGRPVAEGISDIRKRL
ncbi:MULTISPECIES: addiction module protein [unclassified Wenzhouxiangella]|uniref:addiction module protein n=1 Tax=unclassified Wenzhouxiangella TaxID=2613841 RepID=UPI000E3276E1|nr:MULTISPECIES: addiction module protein [unclassified Wenzhouxiangella]RFF27338.1 addiction module protein [Wenzhouxiangella sp. 15181]RFP68770.1 addiction module protein [Wenzhouxiangella sp. 15190]